MGKAKSKNKNIFIIIIVVLLLGGIGAYYILPQGNQVAYTQNVPVNPQNNSSLDSSISGIVSLLDKNGQPISQQTFAMITTPEGQEISLLSYNFEITFVAKNFDLTKGKSFSITVTSQIFMNISTGDIVFTHTGNKTYTLAQAKSVSSEKAVFEYSETYNLSQIITSWYKSHRDVGQNINITIYYGIWFTASGTDEYNIPWNATTYVASKEPILVQFSGPTGTMNVKRNGETDATGGDDTPAPPLPVKRPTPPPPPRKKVGGGHVTPRPIYALSLLGGENQMTYIILFTVVAVIILAYMQFTKKNKKARRRRAHR